MPDTVVMIHVIRSGGFAGLTREWRVEGARDEWMPLVDACPWRNVPRDSASRDRYVWRIEVHAPRKRRRAEVPDAALTGPWRVLVDRVQAA